MIVRFVVTNFLSFNEETEFNMLADSFKTHKHHVYKKNKINVLKASAIYGANGAGKSNLIYAIEFLQLCVKEGRLDANIDTYKFRLSDSNAHKPTVFEIEIFVENKVYAYGVSFDKDFIEEEWLYQTGVDGVEKMVFERKRLRSGKTNIKIADKYQKTQKQKLLIALMRDNLLKNDELFLGKSDELKIVEIDKVRSAIAYDIVIIYPGSKFQGLVSLMSISNSFNDFANHLMKTFDTGVDQLVLEEIDLYKFFGEDDESIYKDFINRIDREGVVRFSTEAGGFIATNEKGKYIVKSVAAQHLNDEGKPVLFDLVEESDGTQRLLDFLPAWDGILNTSIAFIIDEIDQSVHPVLLKALIHKIMADSNTKGQLIFTTHESNLLDLDIFRQDEIWFAEKKPKYGSTQLYSLSDFKPRYDLDIRKGYLKGRFGAIPFLTSLQDLNWNTDV